MTNLIRTIIRFIVSALVLLVVGYIVPGVSINGFMNALAAAAVIAILGYLIEAVMGEGVSPQNRGLIGFIISAVVIYAAQYFISALTVTVIGALIAAFVIGLIDAVVPTELR